jgi:hypothetical protein
MEQVVAHITLTADDDGVHSSLETECTCDQCSRRDAVLLTVAILQLCDERALKIEDVLLEAMDQFEPHAVH